MMSNFVAECRQKKISLQLSSNMQSIALLSNPSACRYNMEAKDVKFKAFHNVLNNVSRKLPSKGIGTVKKQAK